MLIYNRLSSVFLASRIDARCYGVKKKSSPGVIVCKVKYRSGQVYDWHPHQSPVPAACIHSACQWHTGLSVLQIHKTQNPALPTVT